jgi:hypothetical protein
VDEVDGHLPVTMEIVLTLNPDPLTSREVTWVVDLRMVRNDPNHWIYDVVSSVLTASGELRRCTSKTFEGWSKSWSFPLAMCVTRSFSLETWPFGGI